MSNPNRVRRRERRQRWLVALAAITVGPFAGIAHAGEPGAATAPAGDVARAKAQLVIGRQAYDEARHEDALVAFEAAYAAYPVADFHYNIGLCHERLGHVEPAIAAFAAYVEGKPGAQDRPTVERRIEVLKAQLPVASVAEAASAPPTAALRRGSVADLIDPFPPRTQQPPVDDPRESGRPMIAGGAIALALGVGIGVGGGLGFGLPAARRADDVGGRRETNRLLALQYVSVGVGAALVATGVGLLIVGKRKQRRAARHAWLAPTPWGLEIAGSF